MSYYDRENESRTRDDDDADVRPRGRSKKDRDPEPRMASVMSEMDRTKLFSWLVKTIAVVTPKPVKKPFKAKIKPKPVKAPPDDDSDDEDELSESDIDEDAAELEDEENARGYTFDLRHLNASGGTTVEQFTYTLGKSVEMFADEIADRAEEDVAGIGEKSHYVVTSEIVKGRHAFYLNPPDDEGDSYQTDAPTQRGQVSQNMRHTESLLQHMLSSTSVRERSMLKQIQDQQKRIRELEEGRMEMLRGFEDMISQKHLRDIETQSAAMAERRKEQVMDQVTQLLPSVANKFLGARTLPEPTTPEREIMKGLMGSFTDDQFQKLRSVLNPVQTASFLELYESLAKEAAPPKPEDLLKPVIPPPPPKAEMGP